MANFVCRRLLCLYQDKDEHKTEEYKKELNADKCRKIFKYCVAMPTIIFTVLFFLTFVYTVVHVNLTDDHEYNFYEVIRTATSSITVTLCAAFFITLCAAFILLLISVSVSKCKHTNSELDRSFELF